MLKKLKTSSLNYQMTNKSTTIENVGVATKQYSERDFNTNDQGVKDTVICH